MTIFFLSLFAFLVNGLLTFALFMQGHPGSWIALVVVIANLSIVTIAINSKHRFDD